MKQERLIGRHQPHNSMFARAYRNCTIRVRSEKALVVRVGPDWCVWSLWKKNVLDAVKNNPSTSMLSVAFSLRVPHNSAQRTLNARSFHAFYPQSIKLLLPEDHPASVKFAQWYLQQSVKYVNFPAYVLFTDESTFDRDGVF